MENHGQSPRATGADRPRPLTQSQAREKLRALGLTLRVRDGECRVNFRGGKEATAYYTTALEDAVATGGAMSKRRSEAHLPRPREVYFTHRIRWYYRGLGIDHRGQVYWYDHTESMEVDEAKEVAGKIVAEASKGEGVLLDILIIKVTNEMVAYYPGE